MLKKYKPFLRAGAIDTMAYRFNILIWAVITVCQVACLVFLWLAVYRSSAGGMDAEIHGFTYREMIAYVVLTTIFNFVTFNNDTLWFINNDIRKGTIGNYLIKPISYRGKFAATSFGSLLTMTALFGLPFYTAALLALRGLGFLPRTKCPNFLLTGTISLDKLLRDRIVKSKFMRDVHRLFLRQLFAAHTLFFVLGHADGAK